MTHYPPAQGQPNPAPQAPGLGNRTGGRHPLRYPMMYAPLSNDVADVPHQATLGICQYSCSVLCHSTKGASDG